MKRTNILAIFMIITILIMFSSCWLFGPSSGGSGTEKSESATPTSYKIAVINLELTGVESDGTTATSATVINASSANPIIIDFSPSGSRTTATEYALDEYINTNSLGELSNGATYTGFILTPLYIEMDIESTFHVPSFADEYGYSMMFTSDPDVAEYTYRFYFNSDTDHDGTTAPEYWKKDIVVKLENILDDSTTPAADPNYPDGWYWMRRGLETGLEDFFILAEELDGTNPAAHPGTPPSTSTAGSESVLDNFGDDPFWGNVSYFNDPSVELSIDSDDSNDYMAMVRGWTDFTYTTGYELTLTTSIEDTLNFGYEGDPSKLVTTMATDTEVVDFGPWGPDIYGDFGFHTFLPDIELSAAPAS